MICLNTEEIEEKNRLIANIAHLAFSVDEIPESCNTIIKKSELTFDVVKVDDIINLNKPFTYGKAKFPGDTLIEKADIDGKCSKLTFKKIYESFSKAKNCAKQSATVCCLGATAQPWPINIQVEKGSEPCHVTTVGDHVATFHADSLGSWRTSVMPFCNDDNNSLKLWVIAEKKSRMENRKIKRDTVAMSINELLLYIIANKDKFYIVKQNCGECVQHNGGHMHAVITKADKKVPCELTLSIGVIKYNAIEGVEAALRENQTPTLLDNDNTQIMCTKSIHRNAVLKHLKRKVPAEDRKYIDGHMKAKPRKTTIKNKKFYENMVKAKAKTAEKRQKLSTDL